MNITEILKYCPKGTKLYSPTWADVEFDRISEENFIIIKLRNDRYISLFSNGYYSVSGECVLFPSKTQRDWNKFRLPVKKGDIMMSIDGSFIFIANGHFNTIKKLICPKSICSVNRGTFQNNVIDSWITCFYIPASEEAKKELFDKMTETGYKWNADTLELEEIKPKFKEGDVTVNEDDNLYLILNADNNFIGIAAILHTNGDLIVYDALASTFKGLALAAPFNRNKLFSALVREGYKYDKEQHKLIKQEFKPFDKVLARDNETESWNADIYLKYLDDTYLRYKCASSNYRICIPYEGNEYLLGTTNSPT